MRINYIIKKIMVAKKEEEKRTGFALGRENYKLMALGFAVIIIGFILMAGGRSDDPKVFSEDIFNFRRVTLAPLIVLAGFVFEIYAIMKRPRE